MTKYAVIQISGKQYQVSEGDTLTLNRLDAEPGKTITVGDVMLAVSGDKIKVGTPLISGAKVTLKVVDHAKGDKIRVAKYRAKSRYRRVHGHRQAETTVEVVSIA